LAKIRGKEGAGGKEVNKWGVRRKCGEGRKGSQNEKTGQST
jgi:hypothetical protein